MLGAITCFALALGLVACSPAAPTDHAGHGIAVEVDPKARTVTLDHGDIPGLMKAMTMTFAVAPEVDLGTLEPGTPVDFQLHSEGSAITVTAIRATAP
jgi:Cu/Ag efflux protein CusF